MMHKFWFELPGMYTIWEDSSGPGFPTLMLLPDWDNREGGWFNPCTGEWIESLTGPKPIRVRVKTWKSHRIFPDFRRHGQGCALRGKILYKV